MKNYICAILLLMCGLAHFATQVQGTLEIISNTCHYESEVFSVGTHTRRPCQQAVCEKGGNRLVLTSCPVYSACGRHNRVIGYTFLDDSKEYPDCCPQPICESDLNH